VQLLRRMGQEVAMFVNRAALDRDIRPQRRKRGGQARSPIDDQQVRRGKPAGSETIEESPPGGLALATHIAQAEQHLLSSDSPVVTQMSALAVTLADG
jgi:hypothetical protein